ncbi:alpha/beta fold hydrolase [Streptomyces luteogriseus]|uniref:Surfactin synthase thioesterase subunit n=1 Tax=Streptomyces luteogriseus TaxID=68233 RepID=A0A7W7DU94_9ACTN|nr:alpha/beta fold hydrolase [Streptomyces luteogriseus]MBB4716758.1 surfactin synthase thioesterase subunit [Streptomyces luteogriseus]
MNTEVEARREAVVRAWRETLESDPASDDEDFFEAGGNSLLAVQLQRRLTEALGHRVPLRHIHDHPTVRGLLGLRPPRQPRPAHPEAAGASVLNLYCLPYAGSSARMYEPWKTRLPSSVAVTPLELPGRGARWPEHAKSELEPLLDDLAGTMEEAHHAPYAVFGHSFGGILAFELVRHLRALGFPPPRRLLVSGCPAPHLATPAETTYDLSDEEFTQRLRRLRGTPEELLENEELMELYIPILRADYTILDHYKAPPAEPLDCPVSVFYGRGDEDAGRDVTQPWSAYSGGPMTIEEIDGDHFFLRDAEDELLTKMARHLEVPRPGNP